MHSYSSISGRLEPVAITKLHPFSTRCTKCEYGFAADLCRCQSRGHRHKKLITLSYTLSNPLRRTQALLSHALLNYCVLKKKFPASSCYKKLSVADLSFHHWTNLEENDGRRQWNCSCTTSHGNEGDRCEACAIRRHGCERTGEKGGSYFLGKFQINRRCSNSISSV